VPRRPRECHVHPSSEAVTDAAVAVGPLVVVWLRLPMRSRLLT
jgi:hypothetical protein